MSGNRMEKAWGRPVKTRLSSEETLLIVPEDGQWTSPVEEMQQSIHQLLGQRLRIVRGGEVGPDEYAKYHMIVVGSMLNNPVMLRLYNRRCCFIDAVYPGDAGYFVKSLADPFGYGRNLILVGGSTAAGIRRACAQFLSLLPEGEMELGRIHAVDSVYGFGAAPEEEEIPAIIARNVASWRRGWTSSPMGAATNYALLYYLTDDRRWADLLVGTLCGSVRAWADLPEYERSQHVFFRLDHLIHMWDLIEGSEVFRDEDRATIAHLLLDLTRHLSHAFYFWPEANPEGEIRQNHSTFIAWNLFAAIEYFKKRYGLTEFDRFMGDVERIFAGQARSYKPNDDAGGGYIWLVPQHTISYFLARDDDRCLKEGRVWTLADLAIVTTDNRRSECSYGDAGGYSSWSPSRRPASLSMLSMASWYYEDGRYRWAYDWLSEGREGLSPEELLIGLYGNRVAPSEPKDFCGVRAILLDEAPIEWAVRHFEDRRWTPAPQKWRPDPEKEYFDKLSFRGGFDPQQEYLMLEGAGTYCHGHEDGNSIVRLTWKDRVWLGEGDYIRATPKFHTSIVVIHNGESGTLPPLTSLNLLTDTERYGFTQTEVVGYNGVDWRRNILWRKGRYFAVVDELEATEDGDYKLRCLWRTLGDVTLEGDHLTVDQMGEEFYIRNADDSVKTLMDEEARHSHWDAYEYADGVVKVLHQKKRCHLRSGGRVFFFNLLCVSDGPSDEGYTVERIGEGIFGITGRGERAILGAAGRLCSLGDMNIEATLFCLADDHLMAAGCTLFKIAGVAFRSDEPVSLEIDLRTGEGTVEGKKETGIEIEADEVVVDGQRAEGKGQRGGWRGLILLPGRHTLQLTGIGREIKDLSPGSSPKRLCITHKSSPSFPKGDLGGFQGLFNPPCPPFSKGGNEDMGNDKPKRGEENASPSLAGKGVGGLGPAFGLTKAWETVWEGCITAMDVGDVYGDGSKEILIGTERGQVVLVSAKGAEHWRYSAEARINRVHLKDVNGDGKSEAVLAGDDASVSLLSAEGTLLWRREIEALIRTQKVVCVTAGDLGGNGDISVLAGTEGWQVYAFDGSGKERWRRQIKYHAVTEVLADDLDGDGRMEVVVGTEYSTPLNVLNYDGTMRWFTWEQVGSEARSTTTRNGSHLTQVTVADLDRDGMKEIIYGTGDNWVYAVRPMNGGVLWEAHVGGEVVGLFVDDLDGNGEEHVIVGGEYGDLFLFDRRGRRRWWKEIGERICCMAVGDVDGDGTSEIVVGVDEEMIEVYDGEGRLLGSSRKIVEGVGRIWTAVMADREPARILCADGRGGLVLLRFEEGS